MRSLFFASLLLVSALLPAAADQPPTLDPTYGMPLPKMRKIKPQPAPHWIWAANTTDTQTVLFRKVMTLTKVPAGASVFVTADNFFTLFVNGKEIDHSASEPGNDVVWQQTHSDLITPYLHAGKNVIAVEGINAGGTAGMLLEIREGDKPVLLTDADWSVHDGALPDTTWTAANYNAADWPHASVEFPLNGGPWQGALQNWPGYSADVPYLAHITLPPTAFLQIHNGSGHIDVTSVKDGTLEVTTGPEGTTDPPTILVDFGQEMAGRLAVNFNPAAKITAGTGESDDEANLSPWGGLNTLDGTAPQPWHTRYSAFRYAKITFYGPAGSQSYTGPAVIKLDDKYYPVQYKGAFDCSDPTLTKIWYTGAYTTHLCMQEDIWDAPKRDRARWMGDLQVSGRVIDTVFADKFLMEQTMQRLRDDAQSGHPADQLPGNYVNGIPGYSAAWVVGLEDLYRHIDDLDYVKKQHELLISMLEYMKQDIGPDGLFTNRHNAWDYVDWSPGFYEDSPLTRAATQMYYVKAMKDASELFTVMGDPQNASKWNTEAAALASAAQAHLLESDNTFGTRRQVNAMAIFAGVATPEQESAIFDKVLQPDAPDWQTVATPYYNNYVIYAMSEAGHTESALAIVRRIWGGMLDEGATTFWEGYDPSWTKEHFHLHLQADNNTGTIVSLCHGWSTGPTSFLTERILGVRPRAGGYSQTVIAPNLAGLKWASGTIPTPHGPIHIMVQLVDGQQKVSFDTPPGVHVLLKLPAGAKLMQGKGRMLPGQKEAEYSLIGSGKFEAVSALPADMGS